MHGFSLRYEIVVVIVVAGAERETAGDTFHVRGNCERAAVAAVSAFVDLQMQKDNDGGGGGLSAFCT